MKNIKLNDFKAHSELVIDFSNKKKNLLLYGDNGAGKSSICEAMKLIFFRDKVSLKIQSANTDEEQEQYNSDFWSKYNNKASNSDFGIEINSKSYIDFNTENHQAFILSLEDIATSDTINLNLLLSGLYFDLNEETENFCLNNYSVIQNSVNDLLDSFKENISIIIDNEDDYSYKIMDEARNLESKSEITKYFNEAKLNLIILLTIFESIKLSSDNDKIKVLILDDFITSLDVSNRTFIIRYIFDNFKDFQICIFTHNVFFYNLIFYLINDIYSSDSRLRENKWLFANIYEINNVHKLYVKNLVLPVKDLRGILNDNPADIDELGNKIRQKFEVLLYEFSKLLMIGVVEDSKKILGRIQNEDNLYFKIKTASGGKNKTASDLIDEIENILDNTNLKHDIEQLISGYKYSDFNNFRDIILNLKLYQKVTLHPMSHGSIGQSSFTITEIKESLDLLEKFETSIKSFTNKAVDGF